jgi:hypothetical protein
VADERIYRALTLLYPQDFRDHYRDDLTQAHADLVHQRGRSRGWCRSGLDLLITVPRYRLETIMNPRHSDTAILLVIGALIAVARSPPLTSAHSSPSSRSHSQDSSR